MLLQKINNVVNSIMKEEITDKIQNILEMTFDKVKNTSDWKSPTIPKSFTITFDNYERIIQVVGLICMAFVHFHGGYELNRIGESNTIIVRSAGYYHYM